MDYERSGNVGLYFLLGGITGAALALLFAPRSGREVRQLIGEKVQEGQGLAGRAMEKGREVADQARHYVRSMRRTAEGLEHSDKPTT